MDIGTGKDLPTSSKFKVPACKRFAMSDRQNARPPCFATRSGQAKSQFKIKNFRIGYYDFDGIPLWLLDIVKPDYQFNVADYKKGADLVIGDILKRGKLPIVVGGTGFYIKAIADGIETIAIEPDWELRNELQKSPVSELQRMLEDLDPERSRRMNESDKKNPRRLIRAMEIAKRGQTEEYQAQNKEVNKLFIGLTAPFKFLYERIDRRVDERVKAGAEAEIKKLLREGYDWENSVLGVTIGYREWRDFFENKATREEVIQRWKFAEHSYARRQMTWFKKTLRQAQGKLLRQACTEQRRSTQGQWFDISREGWEEEVEKLVIAWYS